MKYLLGLILLVSVSASAQYSPTAAKTRFVNGIGLGTKDTLTMNAADTVAMIVGRDSLVYFRYKGYWKPLAYNSSLGSYVKYTDTAAMLSPYARAYAYVPYTGATSNLNLGTKNIYSNAIYTGFLVITASGTQVVLTVNSAPEILVSGSGGQTIKLPDATTLANGTTYRFNNNQSSGAIIVNNNSNTLVVSIPSGGYAEVILLDNSIAAGSWDRHFQAPANVSWSTNTFDYAGSITSATWNGNVVAINRGGTGSSTQNFVDLTTTQTIGGAKTFSSSLTASSLIKTGGTSSQYLMADGSTSTLTNPVTGTGTSGQVAYFNGTNSITSNAAFAFTPTSQLLVNNSVTAASAIARGTNLTPTLLAAANSDVLVGLDINPTFTNGAFTGVTNVALRVQGTPASTTSPFVQILNNASTVAANQDIVQILTPNVANGVSYQPIRIGTAASGLNSFSIGYTHVSSGSTSNRVNLSFFGQNNIQTIFASGNIGMGGITTDAGFKLDVNGTARVQGTATFSTTNNTSSIQDLVGFTTAAALYLHQATPSGTNYALTSDGTFTAINTPISTNLSFRVNNVTYATLFNTGNFLIQNAGTPTDAGFRLDVNGTARVQNFTTIIASPLVNGDAALIIQPTTNNSVSGTLYGLNNSSTVSTINSASSYIGINSTNAVSTTIVSCIAIQGNVNISAGTTTTVKGFNVNGAVTGTGTANNYIGYDYIDVFKGGSGAVSRQFGLRIGNLTAGGAANVGLLFNNAANTSVSGTWDIYSQSGNNSYLAGSIGIGASTINASAQLQIESTTKGFLPPRMTTTQKNAISSPATGLVVYDTTLNKLAVYTGSAWETVTSL